MSTVALQGITHRYESVDVLSHVDLEIPHGSLFTLLGPSGCGKTTLLRILAGFVIPTEGRVLIDGEDATELACEKRNMGVVFQNYALFPNLTVRENIAYGLKVRGVKGAQAQERCARYISLVGLDEYENRHVQELSGGQQQRVAIARALVIEPQMLLLDEPMSNLDVALRVKMREEIRTIQQKTGITTLFITHDQQEALSISDRIAVMRNGLVLQVGSPEEIYNHPSCDFVANFVGTTNSIDGKRFRPEQLRLTNPGQEGIAVSIESSRFVGPYYEYTVRARDDERTFQVLEVNKGDGSARSIGSPCVLTMGPDCPAPEAAKAAESPDARDGHLK